MKILMTGGSGLLGSEIKRNNPEIISPKHEELDITDFNRVLSVLKKHQPDIVLHLAAFTKPPEHEKNPEPGIKINIIGTANLALACHQLKVRMVYTSTDYLYIGSGPHREDEHVSLPYKFAWSKLGGECSVAMLADSLILRLSFGPVPFPWNEVYQDQYNSKLYVDEIAPLVLAAAKSLAKGILNIGGSRATLEDYAKRTVPDIKTIAKPDWVPGDTSMDITKMKQILNIDDEQKLLKH